MRTSEEPQEILSARDRDALLRDLRRLAASQAEEAKRAGAYLQERALESLGSFTEKRAKESRDERALIELAREIVLGRARMPELPKKWPAPWDRMEALRRKCRIRECVQLFERRLSKRKDLESTPALEAYLDEYVTNYRAAEKRQGMRPTPSDQIRSRRESELAEPDGSETERLFAFHLAIAIQGIVDMSSDALRTRKDWWRVVVGVLLIEDPDTPPASLGVSTPIVHDEWNESDGSPDLLTHREGMRQYSSIDPKGDPSDRARWRAMWELGLRAKEFLAEPTHGSSGAAGAGNPEPVVAPDCSWIRARGTTFHFSTPSQRAVIRALHEEWKRAGADGCGLTTAALAEAIESAASRLRMDRIFLGHPCLGRILKQSGKVWALHLRPE